MTDATVAIKTTATDRRPHPTIPLTFFSLHIPNPVTTDTPSPVQRIRTGSAPIGSAFVPDLDPRFDELLRRLGEISDLQRAAGLLVWDQETKMPPLGAPARAEQLATLARLAHDRATAPELGSLLEELRELEESSDPESFEASVVRVARSDHEKRRRVPSELRAEMTRAGSLGY
ncbi:MAG TPA: hypothetical protein VJV76_08855, partial [Gaiellaceae bacterium]|nr:hypothetical protein [Gaiellaceae bacterium]